MKKKDSRPLISSSDPCNCTTGPTTRSSETFCNGFGGHRRRDHQFSRINQCKKNYDCEYDFVVRCSQGKKKATSVILVHGMISSCRSDRTAYWYVQRLGLILSTLHYNKPILSSMQCVKKKKSCPKTFSSTTVVKRSIISALHREQRWAIFLQFAEPQMGPAIPSYKPTRAKRRG